MYQINEYFSQRMCLGFLSAYEKVIKKTEIYLMVRLNIINGSRLPTRLFCPLWNNQLINAYGQNIPWGSNTFHS